jgi:transcriptional regulator with XRE-family HTH domain
MGAALFIGDRLRELREERHLTQGDIEIRAGLKRCYTSRVENGNTVPALATLEKYAHAFEIPLYRIFCDAESHPVFQKRSVSIDKTKPRGIGRKETLYLEKLRRSLAKLSQRDRNVLFAVARMMAHRVRQKKISQ